MSQVPSAAERLRSGLAHVIEKRRRIDADATLSPRWRALKAWQSERLRQTYLDLFAQPKYRQAGEFFLQEIYGARDFEQRDVEALRVVSKLARMLPDKAIHTLALAVELDALTEDLDARVAACLALPIDAAGYAEAYRTAGTPQERTRQIEMIGDIGRSLERLARVPLLVTMLHMMRAPAVAAGLSHLHFFLENGFAAFKAMGPATAFLATIDQRERALMQRVFDGAPEPFSAPADLPARAP